MVLKEPQARILSKLTVISGVIIKEKDREQVLFQYDEMDIHVAIPHSAGASKDSLRILTQG